MLLAGLATSFITWFMIKILPLRSGDAGFMVIVPKFIITVSISIIAYIIVSYLIGLKEAKPVVEKLVKFVGQK